MNVVAFIHAYKFTHFSETAARKTENPELLSNSEKIKALVLGANLPRPYSNALPLVPYDEVFLENSNIACWNINANQHKESKGTIILCHGYGGEKSNMLEKAYIFRSLGYNTFLLDFKGAGKSSGNIITIGYNEANQLKQAVMYLQKQLTTKIILFGTSMGAVAIMKMVADDTNLHIHSIIMECPFGTMLQAVQSRFHNMKVPDFPLANLLVLWGGIQHGFNGFAHNPINYATKIDKPTLLMIGALDITVSQKEIKKIFNNLAGKKTLKVYEHAGHNNYLMNHKADWTKDVSDFLISN